MQISHRLRFQAVFVGLSVVWGGLGAALAKDIGVAAAVRNEARGTVAGPLAPGSKVYEQEVVSTGDASMAQLLFLDETTLSIGPLAKVKLDSFVYDPGTNSGQVALSAAKGVFRFITGSQNPRNYTIKTPVAALGVRGTVVDFILQSPGPSIFQVQEGSAVITVAGRVYALAAGQQLTVEENGAVTGPGAQDGKIRKTQSGVPFPLFGSHFGDVPQPLLGGDWRQDRIDQLDARVPYVPEPPPSQPEIYGRPK